ncbi:WD40 repeat - like 10 [Theobroma cacao]|nr:WD40 repeat - like 10 [Theobroma cacao]
MEGILSATDEQRMVSSFLEIAVGQTAETAMQFLQATSWKLDEAIQLFYVGNEGGVVGSSSVSRQAENMDSWAYQNSSALNEHDNVGSTGGDAVRPPLPVVRETLHDDAMLHGASRLGYPPQEFRNFDEETIRPGVWQSDEGASSTVDAPRDNLASLYRPPFHLMFQGPFRNAKAAASLEDKWLVVNLQSMKEFSSHMLNRDTWGNETVSQAIKTNFIFWQAYDDASEGRKDQNKRHHPLDLNTLKGHADSVAGLCFSSDGRNLATACADGVVRVFKLEDASSKSFKFLRITVPAGGHPMAVVFSEDASSIVVASQTLTGCSLYMYGEEKQKATNDSKQQTKLPLPEIKWEHHKIHEKRAILTLTGATASYGTADGSTIIASCSEGTDIVLWHGKTGKVLGHVDTNQLKNTMATISPNGRFLAAAAFTADVKVWEIVYSKDGSVKEVLNVMQLKGHKACDLLSSFFFF